MIARPEESDRASEDALHRFVRWHSGAPSLADKRELSQWLAANPIQRADYEQFDRIWNDLDHLAKEPFPELDDARAWWSGGTFGSAMAFPSRRWRAIRLTLAGVFATLLVLVAGAYWCSMLRLEVADYRTGKGEQRTVVLADGSTVMLAADTALSEELSNRYRTVRLHRGEALFRVKHEIGRPFSVLAANGTVRDIGTVFAVHSFPDRVQVSVLEGLVEVRAHAAAQVERIEGMAGGERDMRSNERTVLTEGDRLWYGRDGRLSTVQKVDRDLITASFHGKLVFDALPLGQVIEEVSRYRDGEIRILDQSLSSLPVSGVFHQDHLDGLLRALELALPVKVTSVNPSLVILERRHDRRPSTGN
ncbi:MAG TPA: FecR domain-containing protein [Nitrospiraceae bacterium]|nr:FecR domain-containing protein [Nitrospiraceae bacterium]